MTRSSNLPDTKPPRDPGGGAPAGNLTSGPAIALMALPLLIATILLVLPADADRRVTGTKSAEAVLDAAGAHPDGSWYGLILAGVAYLVAAAAILPVARAATGRAGVFVRIGYWFSVLGAVGLAMANAAVAVSLRASIDHDVDRASSVATQVALQHDHGPLFPLYMAGIGVFLGPILLAVGSIWCSSIGWWRGLLAAALLIGLAVAQPGVSGLIYLAVTLAAAIAILPLTFSSRQKPVRT